MPVGTLQPVSFGLAIRGVAAGVRAHMSSAAAILFPSSCDLRDHAQLDLHPVPAIAADTCGPDRHPECRSFGTPDGGVTSRCVCQERSADASGALSTDVMSRTAMASTQ